jgi:hypothetical protein
VRSRYAREQSSAPEKLGGPGGCGERMMCESWVWRIGELLPPLMQVQPTVSAAAEKRTMRGSAREAVELDVGS